MPRFKAPKDNGPEGKDPKARAKLEVPGDDKMDTAARVLELAKETADEAVADAKREAEQILAQAREEAAQIVAKARTHTEGP